MAVTAMDAFHAQGRLGRRLIIRPLAMLVVFIMTISGVFVSQTFSEVFTPVAQARTGGQPISVIPATEPEWTVVPNYEAVWSNGGLIEDAIYWSTDGAYPYYAMTAGSRQNILWQGWDWADEDDPTGFMSTYRIRPVLAFERTVTGGPDGFSNYQFSSQAMARIGGMEKNPDGPLTVYFWSYVQQAYNGPASCPINHTPIVRVTSGEKEIEWSCMPTMGTPGATGFTPTLGTGGATGGEADQYTGNLYIVRDTASFIDNQSDTSAAASTNPGWIFMVWNPETGAYSLSGSIQPGDWYQGRTTVPQERLSAYREAGSTVNARPYVASDIALDGDGNVYTYAGLLASSTASANMSIIRMEPARNSAGDIVNGTPENPWRYYVVSKITKNPAYPNEYWAAADSIYGLAFLNGQMLLGGYTTVYPGPNSRIPATGGAGPTGITRMVKLDPMSSTGTLVWSIENDQVSAVDAARDNASPQTAQVIRGTLYHDLNGDGVIDRSTDAGIPNQTIALYSSSGKLLSTQPTDSMGNYSFIVSGKPGLSYYVRPVQVQTQPEGSTGWVNATQTWAAGSQETATTSGGTSMTNTAEVMCANLPTGSTISYTGETCLGALPVGSPDPAVGARSEISDPATWLNYAQVTLNTSQYVPTADFGFTSIGSYGDAAAGPTAAGIPAHVNWPVKDLWLGTNAGHYTGPATNNSHTSTDDGVYIDTADGLIPLDGTVLAATRTYDMTAYVSGSAAQSAYVAGWTTGAGNNIWTQTPKWTPTITPGADPDTAVATGDFQFQTSGSLATTQTVQMRVDVSKSEVTQPTNVNGEYYPLSTGTISWVTTGEIEDYSFTIANTVWRPAVHTTGGTGDFTVAGQSFTGVGPTIEFGTAQGTAASQVTTTALVPPGWMILGVKAKNTFTGEDHNQALTWQMTNATTASISVGVGLGEDVTIEVLYSEDPDVVKSTLTLDTDSAPAGETITATATIVNPDEIPLTGITVHFSNLSSDVELSESSCVTNSVGKCSIEVTSTKAGIYPDELSAQVLVAGALADIHDSPATLRFTPGDISYERSTFEIIPAADPLDSTKTDWRVADGVQYYTGLLTLSDAIGNGIPDLPVTNIDFEVSDPRVLVSDVTDNKDGTYTVEITSTFASPALTITAHYLMPEVGQTQPIPFMTGPPVTDACSKLTVTPNSVTVDGYVYAVA
ncbi:MAG: Ig-like domain-containing protein, partial [Propionibacteriaceae bacterium]|nr:Ig-like domain-containing protein [Propionibacteriaceae bacterium]